MSPTFRFLLSAVLTMISPGFVLQLGSVLGTSSLPGRGQPWGIWTRAVPQLLYTLISKKSTQAVFVSVTGPHWVALALIRYVKLCPGATLNRLLVSQRRGVLMGSEPSPLLSRSIPVGEL